jgi:hypothetical protein
MRTTRETSEWPSTWVVGLTSRTGEFDGKHWLFYLARVQSAYESHCELWYDLPPKVRQAKSARRHRLGDLYEPLRPMNDDRGFEPAHYHPPILGHAHHGDAHDGKWRIDIDYRSKALKRKPTQIASLLAFRPQFSFLWDTPKVCLRDDHTRNYGTWDTLKEFLQQLRDSR